MAQTSTQKSTPGRARLEERLAKDAAVEREPAVERELAVERVAVERQVSPCRRPDRGPGVWERPELTELPERGVLHPSGAAVVRDRGAVDGKRVRGVRGGSGVVKAQEANYKRAHGATGGFHSTFRARCLCFKFYRAPNPVTRVTEAKPDRYARMR